MAAMRSEFAFAQPINFNQETLDEKMDLLKFTNG